MNHWGKHLILNALSGNCNVLCGKSIAKFSNTLVKRIEMKPFGEPIVHHFGDTDLVKGYSLVQLIHTSCITGHFCDHTRNFYLDIFSCKDYDEKIVESLVRETFNPLRIQSHIVYRDAGQLK